MQPIEFDSPAFLARLRQGDHAAYRALVRRYHRSLTTVAQSIIGSRAQAEEIVQDAWLAVFRGIDRFEGRSSLATWLFTIVLNRARTRVTKEVRLVSLPTQEDRVEERSVPLSAFQPDGHWAAAPRLWDDIDPERIVGGMQIWQYVQIQIEKLPPGQRAVLVLRDMEGQTAEDACRLLNITSENQRVLLHRARTRIRDAVDALTRAPVPLARGTAPHAAARSRRMTRLAMTCLAIGFLDMPRFPAERLTAAFQAWTLTAARQLPACA
ncbi:RNA polymerase sigma factor [Rhodopila sp.]|jgi:RNA polymerase sigma-70 factor (ECF subfamily)|uniref:RNA polymerase sigma factor n=1 Tax=Rhodopila sp. TaxID=2480087 RepID=UPI002B5542E8|nr:sigma-70 family RNA polymerase sigma factor [Rhodopila sp.]HVZ06773.1 sigma-70 family RNA polymerase sigma factor [Rhodopila sp.]